MQSLRPALIPVPTLYFGNHNLASRLSSAHHQRMPTPSQTQRILLQPSNLGVKQGSIFERQLVRNLLLTAPTWSLFYQAAGDDD